MTQVTCWMISWKKSYLRVFGLGNFLNFLNVQDWSEERGLPRFSKRQVSESLFDLKDPKRLERWLNVPSFPNILQTLHVITDMMMKLNPHQSWADMNSWIVPWRTSVYGFALAPAKHLEMKQLIWMAKVMLVTLWCWWLEVGDDFRMFATELRSWWHLLKLGARS